MKYYKKFKSFFPILLIVLLNTIGFSQINDKIIIIDGLNRKTEIPKRPKNIACFVGTSYETLFLFGAADRVKYVSSFQATPWAIKLNPNLKNTALLQNYASPNIEELLKLKIDAVLYWSWPDQVNRMEKAGISVICPPFANKNLRNAQEFILSVKKNILFYENIIGATDKNKLKKYFDYFQRSVARIMIITSKISEDEKPKVYFVGGSNVFDSHDMNSNTYWYITLAGGRFVPAIKSSSHTHIILSMEQVIFLNPDIIMMGRVASKDPVIKNPQWECINAVKNGRVYITPEGAFYWDHSSEGILLLLHCAKIFHPDLFKDINLEAELKYFYSTFYNYNLTNDEARRILNHQPPAD